MSYNDAVRQKFLKKRDDLFIGFQESGLLFREQAVFGATVTTTGDDPVRLTPGTETVTLTEFEPRPKVSPVTGKYYFNNYQGDATKETFEIKLSDKYTPFDYDYFIVDGRKLVPLDYKKTTFNWIILLKDIGSITGDTGGKN
jgi:hypothetical protein